MKTKIRLPGYCCCAGAKIAQQVKNSELAVCNTLASCQLIAIAGPSAVILQATYAIDAALIILQRYWAAVDSKTAYKLCSLNTQDCNTSVLSPATSQRSR